MKHDIYLYMAPILSILLIIYVLDRGFRNTKIIVLKDPFKGMLAGFIFTILLYSGIIFLSCFDSEYIYKLLEFVWPPIHFLIGFIVSQFNLSQYFYSQTFNTVFYICLGVAQWMLLGMFLGFILKFMGRYKK